MTTKTQIELINLLDKTDKTVLRCIENGISIPDDWKTYREEIRSLITAGGGIAPQRPAYPVGT